MSTKAKETNEIDPLRRKPGRMMRRIARRNRAARPMMVFTMIAALCLVLTALLPMSGAVLASTEHISDTPVARAAGKGPRIASMVNFACKGESWGHESSKCLAAILSHTHGERGRPIRIIHIVANTNPGPDTYWLPVSGIAPARQR